MIIYGAGMAGLIAASMLRRFWPEVHEARGTLPLAHKAVLRFRSEAVARATGIPFRHCRVSKALKWGRELHASVTLQQANAYSIKVSGAVLPRSINRLETEDRWIAPDNFTQVLAEQCKIHFNSGLVDLNDKFIDPVISTIPMPIMVNKILALKEAPDFKWKNIMVLRQKLDIRSEVYQSIYYPEPHYDYYRASLEGDTLIVEFPDANDRSALEDAPSAVRDILADFGIGLGSTAPVSELPEIFMQPFGKIQPIDDKWRRDFIFELTQRKNVYSLGRFATWRQLLLDDVVKDVEQIERMIVAGDSYGRRLAS